MIGESSLFFQLLTGGVGVVVISNIFTLYQGYRQRKEAAKAAAKTVTPEKFAEMMGDVSLIKDVQVALMRERLKFMCRQTLEAGWISYEDRHEIIAMHDLYKNKMGGNGNITLMVEECTKLPARN